MNQDKYTVFSRKCQSRLNKLSEIKDKISKKLYDIEFRMVELRIIRDEFDDITQQQEWYKEYKTKLIVEKLMKSLNAAKDKRQSN